MDSTVLVVLDSCHDDLREFHHITIFLSLMTSDARRVPKSQFINELRSPTAAIQPRPTDWELGSSRGTVENGKLIKRQRSTISKSPFPGRRVLRIPSPSGPRPSFRIDSDGSIKQEDGSNETMSTPARPLIRKEPKFRRQRPPPEGEIEGSCFSSFGFQVRGEDLFILSNYFPIRCRVVHRTRRKTNTKHAAAQASIQLPSAAEVRVRTVSVKVSKTFLSNPILSFFSYIQFLRLPSHGEPLPSATVALLREPWLCNIPSQPSAELYIEIHYNTISIFTMARSPIISVSTSPYLSEKLIQDSFHSYLKKSLAQAKIEKLINVDLLASAEGDLMITGTLLS